MPNIIIHSRSGPDGKLRLEVAVGRADTDFEVEVVLRPTQGGRSFQPGYFELIGSVDDETLIVHPQPPVPVEIE